MTNLQASPAAFTATAGKAVITITPVGGMFEVATVQDGRTIWPWTSVYGDAPTALAAYTRTVAAFTLHGSALMVATHHASMRSVLHTETGRPATRPSLLAWIRVQITAVTDLHSVTCPA
jgi:hypothetical protein